jgi:hypothetical protein
MKKPPSNLEFERFSSALSDILKVSKGEMQERTESHKESGKRLSKGASLAPGVSAKIRSSLGDS